VVNLNFPRRVKNNSAMPNGSGKGEVK